jgi:hypothetical protein
MTFNVGDLVSLDPAMTSGNKYRGVNFRVIKVNPKTYRLQPLNGDRVLVADRFLVVPSTLPAGASVEDVPIVEHLVVGTLVKIQNLRTPKGWMQNGTLGVVLVDKGERVNVAPLGGFEDRYARLPHHMLEVVKLSPTELRVINDQLS